MITDSYCPDIRHQDISVHGEYHSLIAYWALVSVRNSTCLSCTTALGSLGVYRFRESRGMAQ